jgi:hypothetical protein
VIVTRESEVVVEVITDVYTVVEVNIEYTVVLTRDICVVGTKLTMVLSIV